MGNSSVDANTGAGLHLLSLLVLLLLVLPALSVVILRAWGHCLRRHRSGRLPAPPVSRGLAAIYPLHWVYRNGDEWYGGLDAIKLDTRRPPSLVPLAGLLSQAAAPAAEGNEGDSRLHWVIYCLEPAADAVVLMEIAPGAELLKEPFLDRGVRQLAGTRAAVVSTTTLTQWAANGGNGVNPMAKGLGWVWNTGRCGSTLLHRVLLAAGVCSLSEPYWLEQLARARSQGTLEDAEIRRLLRLCLLADARLIASAWMPQARGTSVNLKGLGHILLDLAHGLEGPDGRALGLGPTAVVRHLYMYRDMGPVVESLTSVFHSHASPIIRLALFVCPRWTLSLHWPPWSRRLRRWLRVADVDAHAEVDVVRDTKAEAVFAATAGSAALAVGRWGAARALGLSWLDSLATWLEVTQAWPPADKATLRMETFIDPSMREARLARVLRFLLGDEVAKGVMDNAGTMVQCMAVFGVHSQKGNRMERSSTVTGRRFLGPNTAARLQALLASVPDSRIALLQLPNQLTVPEAEHETQGMVEGTAGRA